MAALPVAGMFCAMTCFSASQAMTADHAGQHCEDATAASSGSQAKALSERDCRNHDGAVLSLPTTAAFRADAGFAASQATSAAVHSPFASLVPLTRLLVYTPPPGTAPPTTTPLVLRV
jgi:hypothetical protein